MRRIIYKKRHITRSVIAILLLLVVSCNKSHEQEDDFIANHTLLVYIGADSNLSREVDAKNEQLKAAFEKVPPGGKLLIYTDHSTRGSNLVELRRTQQGRIISRILATHQEDNSADASTFKRVITTLQKEAPSQSYGLLLFSHGSGWLPDGAYNQHVARSIVVDKSNEMEIIDFAKEIPDAFFDYIILEACYMGCVEVFYELRNKTPYIMASPTEITTPGLTPVYKDILPLLFSKQNSKETMVAVAKTFFEHYNNLSGNYQSATISVIKTSEMEPLSNIVQQFPNIEHTQQDAPLLASVQNFTRPTEKLVYLDLQHYLQTTTQSNNLLATLEQQLQKTVIYKAATKQFILIPNGYLIEHFCGMSTYPHQQSNKELNLSHRQTSWGQKIWHR